MVVSLNSFARADIKGDPKILKNAAVEYTANRSKIATWKGQAKIHERVSGDVPATVTESTVEFAYDRKEDATRWNWTYLKTTQVIDGKQVVQAAEKKVNGMRKDGQFYRLTDEGGKKNGKSNTVYVFPEAESYKGAFKDDFDPNYYLTNHGQDIADVFLTFAKEAQNPKLVGWSVHQNGNVVVFERKPPPQQQDGITNRYKVDLAQGGNLIEYFGEDALVRELWEYQHQKIAGVWVPKTVTYRNERLDIGRLLTRRIDFTENVVNGELEDKEFGLSAIGAKSGDRLYDTRSSVATQLMIKDEKPTD